MDHYDVVVVGATSAGFTAAVEAAKHGARVALVRQDSRGGVVVGGGRSVTDPPPPISRHQRLFAPRHWRLRFGQAPKGSLPARYTGLSSERRPIRVLDGRARLVPNGVVVDGRHLQTVKVIIATGAAPVRPTIAGIDGIPYLTSSSALWLPTLPRSVLIIGAGYVGIKAAQMFVRSGVRTAILCRSRLLPRCEPELGEALAETLREDGVAVVDGIVYRRIRRRERGVALAIDIDGDEFEIEAAQVLAATGARPRSHDLGLCRVDVEMGADGSIHVDDCLRTTNPDIFAVADVTGRSMTVAEAALEGRIAARNALNGGGQNATVTMATVLPTDPPAAMIGDTEQQARARGLYVRSAVLPVDSTAHRPAGFHSREIVKVVAERGGGRLLGVHCLALEAGEVVQTAAAAIRANMTVHEFGRTVLPRSAVSKALQAAALSLAPDTSYRRA